MNATPPEDEAPIAETAVEEVPPTLPQRRPAELMTFIAALVVVAAELSIDLSSQVLVAAFVVIGVLPAIVSHYVTIYRDALG